MELTQTMLAGLQLWGGFFGLMCAFVVAMQRRFIGRRNKIMAALFLTNTVVLISNTISQLNMGIPGHKIFVLLHITYFLEYFAGYVEVLLYILYVTAVVEEQEGKRFKVYVYLAVVIATVGFVMLIATQFNGFFYYIDKLNMYHRNIGQILSLCVGIVGMVFSVWVVLRHGARLRRVQTWAMIAYITLPTLALVLQSFHPTWALLNLATTMSIVFMFVVYQLEVSEMLRDREAALHRQQIKEAQWQMRLLQSQIKPHFLFNALSSIIAICEDERAQELMMDFAQYLRLNVDMVSMTGEIPFKKELEHIKTYLKIEQLRFGERLQVEYRIECMDFSLPGLVAETLVENAVRHGISAKPEGGRLILSTRDLGDEIEIRVSDNGMGFDVDVPKNDGKTHTGISNARAQIQSQCGGTLRVFSAVGKGTESVIRIPKERV